MQVTGEVLIKAVEEGTWTNKKTGEVLPLRRVHIFGLTGKPTDATLSVSSERLGLLEKARKLLFQKTPVLIELRKTNDGFTMLELVDFPGVK